MNQPRVSVLMLVYEHQEFVAQAISSVVSQRCEFSYELIVINDHSSDKSAEICRKFADNYPDLIRFIDNKSNVGMHESFARLWAASSATLIAFCEGDDYWVDDYKLQKQVDSFDEHEEWTLCGAKAQIIELSDTNEWLVSGDLQPRVPQKAYSFEQLIGSYNFHFSTVMLRKSSVRFPQWFKTVYCVDRPIYLLAAQGGKAGYLNEVVSAYRIHGAGNWSSISSLRKASESEDLFAKLASHFDKKYKSKFELTLFEILHSYVATEMQHERYGNARKIFYGVLLRSSFVKKLRWLKKYYRTAGLLLIRR